VAHTAIIAIDDEEFVGRFVTEPLGQGRFVSRQVVHGRKEHAQQGAVLQKQEKKVFRSKSLEGMVECGCYIWGGLPIQYAQLNLAKAIVIIELGGKGEIEGTFGKGRIGCPKPHCLLGHPAITEPHLDVLLVWAEAQVGALLSQVACDKVGVGIALPQGLEPFEGGKTMKSHFLETDLGVELEGSLEQFGLKICASQSIEAGAEGFELSRVEAETSGHGVTAMPNKQLAAFAQGACQIESGDASA
jgi:hypothetical protein